MRKIEIHPIGNSKYRATLYEENEDQCDRRWKYIDDWIVEEIVFGDYE